MTRLTAQEIEAIRKRTKKATSGNRLTDMGAFEASAIVLTEDIPKLLAEVEHLTGVIGTLRSKLQLIDGCTYGVPNELTKGAIRYADEELR